MQLIHYVTIHLKERTNKHKWSFFVQYLMVVDGSKLSIGVWWLNFMWVSIPGGGGLSFCVCVCVCVFALFLFLNGGIEDYNSRKVKPPKRRKATQHDREFLPARNPKCHVLFLKPCWYANCFGWIDPISLRVFVLAVVESVSTFSDSQRLPFEVDSFSTLNTKRCGLHDLRNSRILLLPLFWQYMVDTYRPPWLSVSGRRRRRNDWITSGTLHLLLISSSVSMMKNFNFQFCWCLLLLRISFFFFFSLFREGILCVTWCVCEWDRRVGGGQGHARRTFLTSFCCLVVRIPWSPLRQRKFFLLLLLCYLFVSPFAFLLFRQLVSIHLS